MRASSFALSIKAAACGALLLVAPDPAQAGVFTWNGGGPDDNWNTGANWSSGYGPISGNGDELHFAGNTRLTATNSFAVGTTFHAVVFDAGAGAFNLTGNGFTLHDANFYFPQIINRSSATQTFNLSGTLTLEQRGNFTGGVLIEADAGNLVFNNAVRLEGRTELLAVGTAGNTITFNGGISSSADAGLGRLRVDSRGTAAQPFTAIITGANNNYTGDTNIASGALQLGSTGASPLNGSIAGLINIGRDGQSGMPTEAATLVIGGSGNQTVSNEIKVMFGNYGSGEKAIIGKSSGTTTFTGSITANSSLTLATAAGSTMQFNSFATGVSQNILVGSATHANAGTIALTGTTDNTGISAIVSSGTLLLAKTSSSSVHAVNHGLGIETGGTVVLGGTGGDQIGSMGSVILNGGTLNTAGLSETVGALTLRSSSIIDLANGASVLAFADSTGGGTWSGTLSIYNWSGNVNGGGTDQVFFGTSNGGFYGGPTGLTSTQLSQITFYSDAGITSLGTAGWAPTLNGEIVPVPEPSTWSAAVLAVGGVAYTQRRRLRCLLAVRL